LIEAILLFEIFDDFRVRDSAVAMLILLPVHEDDTVLPPLADPTAILSLKRPFLRDLAIELQRFLPISIKYEFWVAKLPH
jgi:hypothetical protein